MTNKQNTMISFSVPTREEVSENSKASFDLLQKALGMVPNLYATIAYSQNGLPKYLAYQGAKTSLNNKEKEAINLIVSQINNCRYCLSAHTVIGKMNGFSDDEMIKIRKGSATDPKLNALVAFAKEVTENKGKVNDEILQSFFDAGYSKGNMVDVILQISDKVAMNYLHNLTEIPIDFPLAPSL